MKIAVLRDGQLVVGEHGQIFQNVSFPASGPTPDWVLENAYPVSEYKEHNFATEKLVPCAPYLDNGTAYLVEVAQKTEADIAAEYASMATNVKQDRNARLAACDWTQVADAQVDKEAWKVYRQALRDLPAQSGFPYKVEWPAVPE